MLFPLSLEDFVQKRYVEISRILYFYLTENIYKLIALHDSFSFKLLRLVVT